MYCIILAAEQAENLTNIPVSLFTALGRLSFCLLLPRVYFEFYDIKAVGVNHRLQVAGYRLQVTGYRFRLQVNKLQTGKNI